MTIDWHPLREALSACRRADLPVPVWWRDDDAIEPTPQLDQLAQLSETVGVLVHLAVIPEPATRTLADTLPKCFVPVVHGWSHTDHSGGVGKKNEFQTPRPSAVAEAAQGLDRMTALFGGRARPMFVPPWNRINETVTEALAGAGYTTLSTFGPRTAQLATEGVRQINTHIDPIFWKGTRDLVDPDHLILQTAAHLNARCRGDEDAAEPLGLLTHHLVHTPAIWSFVEGFTHEMMLGGATPWALENEE
ncbi:polysaccharide deacetylase [uncultured Tateyamaria sp.]|uniref:polysaccharide deacetylase n=1 Tax=uncultured Tateyamaria sp. TaxID=455651 RepID=UPI002634FB97|nr:polysaccharide deacetylase [uncultured Tateyamaria sp.]